MLKKTLSVENLDFSTSESTLNEVFAGFGGEKARVVEGKGFGFVDVDREHSEAAIEAKDGSMLDGRQIQVGYARPGARGK